MANELLVATFTLRVTISASTQRVWQVLTQESAAWWPKDFCTSSRTQRFVIEPMIGGRVFEDFGGGDGLQWYSVVGVEAGKELVLAGHLLPPFGGPAITALRLNLVAAPSGGTVLEIRDDRFGAIGTESPIDGWHLVFDGGLRRYIESQAGTPESFVCIRLPDGDVVDAARRRK